MMFSVVSSFCLNSAMVYSWNVPLPIKYPNILVMFYIYQNSRQHVLTTLLLDLGLCVREIEKGVRFGINFFVTFALWPQHWMCSVNEQCVIIDISWFFQPPWSIFPVTHGKNTFMYVCMKRSHKSSIVSSPGFLLLALPGADTWEKYHSYL